MPGRINPCLHCIASKWQERRGSQLEQRQRTATCSACSAALLCSTRAAPLWCRSPDPHPLPHTHTTHLHTPHFYPCSWALEYNMEAESEYRQESWRYNLEVAAAVNASGDPLDFVIFGDSMTARIRRALARPRPRPAQPPISNPAATLRSGAREGLTTCMPWPLRMALEPCPPSMLPRDLRLSSLTLGQPAGPSRRRHGWASRWRRHAHACPARLACPQAEQPGGLGRPLRGPVGGAHGSGRQHRAGKTRRAARTARCARCDPSRAHRWPLLASSRAAQGAAGAAGLHPCTLG